MVAAPNLCIKCKGGRNLCGNNPCPLLARIKVQPKIKIDKEFFGPSTSVFVGSHGYPRVSIGPMGAIENENLVDKPGQWFGMAYDKIIEMRSLTVRSKSIEYIKSKSKFVEENQQLAMSRKPTDVDMLFKKKPDIKFNFSDITQPMGPSASLEKLKVVDNPQIPRQVEYIVKDDLKSAEQVKLLYKNHYDTYYITNIFASGALGNENKQKLVPTRWSITALDDLLSKEMMERIRNYKPIETFLVYESKYLDNNFVVLLMPGAWEFENFEAWARGSLWNLSGDLSYITIEHEFNDGRSKYADLQVGGYYASRFAVTENLFGRNKQARVMVIREIDTGYVVPVGV